MTYTERTRSIHKEDPECPRGMRERTQDRVGHCECKRAMDDRKPQARQG